MSIGLEGVGGMRFCFDGEDWAEVDVWEGGGEDGCGKVRSGTEVGRSYCVSG